MANILLEQAFKALEDIQDVEISAKDLYESKEEYNLPEEVTIDVETYGIDLDSDEDEITEWLSDYLSDTYGFCHFGFDWEYGDDVGTITCYNIKWDTSESLDKYITEEDDLKESCSDADLVDKLVAFGTCDSEEEAEKRVSKMSQEMKDEMCKSLSAQAKDHLLNDSLKEEKHVCEKCGKEVCECDKKLQEGPNITTTISVLDDGEKVIKQSGYSALCKKLINGKPVYTVKYAPGYVVNTIEAKHDKEAINKFLGINECLKEELEREYYVVSYGNPYKARIFSNEGRKQALELAKSLNSVENKEGEWEVYHYTQPVGGELNYEIIKESIEEVAREEYCVLVNGNNEECYSSEEDAIKFARKRFAEEGNDSEVKVLLVKYGPKDEHGDEAELGFETVWANHFEESCNESKEDKLAIKYWVDEEHRDQGLSDLYFGEIKDLEDAKHIADKLFDEYASVEVVKNVDTDHEEVLYGRYPEDESLKEEKNSENWKYKLVINDYDLYIDDEDKEGLDNYEEENFYNEYPDDDIHELTVDIGVDSDLYEWKDGQWVEIENFRESLKEELSKDEKSVSEEHKEDDKVVCAKCGSEEVKFNDPETKEPLCADCFEKRSVEFEEKVLGKEKLEEGITVNINDAEEVKKAKEEIEKSETRDDTVEKIVDVDAESIEDLKDSYLGNVILTCNDCMTPRFIKPELLKKDEETGLYNVGEACSHCGSENGYKVSGQVASADVEVDETSNDTTGANSLEIKSETKEEVKEEEPKVEFNKDEEKHESRLENLDLNEQRFDRLVNKFVHTTYENVDSYSTKSLYLDDDNTLIVEGVIKYTSGKEKEAQFKLVEKKTVSTKEDVVALNGICEAFNTSEKAFTFRGNIKENKLDLNSLTYNFNTKVLNESKNIKGKVCIKY